MKKAIVFLITITLVLNQITGVALALDAEQKKLYNQNILYYDLETGCEGGDCVCNSGGTTSTLTGSDNEEKTWNYFIGKGLNAPQVAGIMGNISRESSFNPEKIQNPGGTTKDPSTVSSGWGLIQWTPGSKILGIAREAKITSPIHLLETQLDIVWWHMNNISPTGQREMINRYKTTETSPKLAVDALTIIFEDLMEGAGVPAYADRQARAWTAHQKYAAGGSVTTTTSTGTQTCTTNVSGGENAAVTSDGYALPVRKQGVNLPCRNSTCHHDGTPAADLFRPDGDPVYAITSGKIENFRYRPGFGRTAPAPQECKQFQLVGDDGWSYWYGHIKNVTVDNGTRVTAGQKIAEVGPTRCADDTPPHLHIDRGSPKGEFGGRQCCRDPGFIPLLNKIFEDSAV